MKQLKIRQNVKLKIDEGMRDGTATNVVGRSLMFNGIRLTRADGGVSRLEASSCNSGRRTSTSTSMPPRAARPAVGVRW